MMKSMKRIVGLMVMAGMLMFPLTAKAADGQLGVYGSAKVIYGAAFMKDVKSSNWINYRDMWDSTLGGSLAAGYDFSKKLNIPVRAELEYAAFTEAEVWPGATYGQSYRAQTLFMNVYYDINTGTKFTPYVGAGLGAGFIRTKYNDDGLSGGSKTVTNFAWNIGLGLGYQFTNNIAMDIGYRFADLGKVYTEWDNPYGGTDPYRMETKRMYQHQFAIGARFTF